MEKKRNRLQIIRDVLQVISSRNGKIKPTHILYKSNLSHQMMSEILQELKEKEFIKEQKTEKSRTYSLTEKGFEFLKQYRMINDFTTFFGVE